MLVVENGRKVYNHVVLRSEEWIGGAFTGNGTPTSATEARFNSKTRILEIDADGDANVDMEIEMTNVDDSSLDQDDFVI